MANEGTDITTDLVTEIMGQNPSPSDFEDNVQAKVDNDNGNSPDTQSVILEGMKGLSDEYQKSLQIIVERLGGGQGQRSQADDQEGTKQPQFKLPGIDVSFDAGAGLKQFLDSGENDIHDVIAQRDDVISKLISGANEQADQMTSVINTLQQELAETKALAQGSYKYADDQILMGDNSAKVINSPEFQTWMKEQNPVARQAYEQTVRDGSAANVKVLLDEYNKSISAATATQNATEQPQPEAGVSQQIQAAAAAPGLAGQGLVSQLPGINAGGMTLDNLPGGRTDTAADSNLEMVLSDPVKVQAMFDKVAAERGPEAVKQLAAQLLGR